MSKDTRLRSSKLLPVITRQKKSKSVPISGNSPSHSPDSSSVASQHCDVSASHKGVDSATANHKSRKIEGVKQDRREVVEGTNKSSIEKVIVLSISNLATVWDNMCTQLRLKSACAYAQSNWRPGGCGFEPPWGQQHSFMEIDHEIFSTVILSFPLIPEGQLSVSGERICTTLVNSVED